MVIAPRLVRLGGKGLVIGSNGLNFSNRCWLPQLVERVGFWRGGDWPAIGIAYTGTSRFVRSRAEPDLEKKTRLGREQLAWSRKRADDCPMAA